MGYNKIHFDQPIRDGLHLGDNIYYTTYADGVAGTPILMGHVVTISLLSNYIEIDVGDGDFTSLVNPFILYSKPIQINESSIKGYYADVEFENSSNKKAELFAVSSEVSPSSK
tara:strand:+ start:1029 stop:1367 length:339 start_codon:yes stop_codon:yes gene_type:complete